MATTVHIPPQLLESVDREARRKKVSRNKYIVAALRARLETEGLAAQWPKSFFEAMSEWRADEKHVDAVRELTRGVYAARRSKKPIAL